MQLLKSRSDSPAYNAALENDLLTGLPEPEEVLLFYINRPSVIVGRNQQIAAEVNTAYCQAHGIEVIKRISGGGTVYHDYGNINYAFITRKGSTPALEMDFATPIIAALQSLGVTATAGKRKELLINGKKISGTASHVTRNRILFHGTLLHRSNLEQLSFALQGDPLLRGRRIASVPSPVVNISDITGTTETTEVFLKQLLNFFVEYYNSTINII
ncbi:MAG: lipoate--protein ligase family protein [Tannerella sp.]|jgi:lipoate-protein ligase A|nr:lipoate--protein ligase family protein [Tannerella sp.]